MGAETAAGARITNAGLSEIITKTDTRLCLIEDLVGRIDKALNGNGRPGLIEDHRILQHLVEGHIEQSKLDTEARSLLATETKAAKELLASETKASKDMLAAEVKELLATDTKSKKEAAELEAKTRKDKISVRVWALVSLAIGAFITQAAGLIALYLRMGTIR